MSAVIASTRRSAPDGRRRHIARRAGWTVLGVAGVALLLACVLYLRLLAGPLSLGFLSAPAEGLVGDVLPPGLAADVGDTSLSLDGLAPVLRFSPVALHDEGSGASIALDALEVGFSPLWALLGRPGAYVTLDSPRLQLAQELDGARLARFDLIADGPSGVAQVQHSQTDQRASAVTIGAQGLSFASPEAIGAIRSDNDWLMINVETLDRALADFADRAASGALARLRVRGGGIDLHDAVYGTLRSFRAIEADIWAGGPGTASVEASFVIGGRTTEVSLSRTPGAENGRLAARMRNLDFSALIPFMDDADAMTALRGAGSLDMDFAFNPETGSVRSGRLTVDLTGADLRMQNDLYPIAMQPLDIVWHPEDARFSFADGVIAIGDSRAVIEGDFALGLDPRFGPVVGMSITARDVHIAPHDLEPTDTPFDVLEFSGWSTPLYAAMGIDRLRLAREGVEILARGRIDTLAEGPGIALSISGTGASADDIKRIWPYVFSPDARRVVIDTLEGGRLREGTMRFDFPVGSIALDGSPRPTPEGALEINLVGEDIALVTPEGLPPLEIEGTTRVSVVDNQLQIGFERAVVDDPAGEIAIANAVFFNSNTAAERQIFEVSGDIAGAVPTLLRAADSHAPDALEDFDIGTDFGTLAEILLGQAEATVIATIATDDTGTMVRTDYALNGRVTGLETSSPIEGFSVAEGSFAFTASQEGFRVTGGADVQDVPITLQASRAGTEDPQIAVAATLDVAEAARFGVDLSEFFSGSVSLQASPRADGTIAVTADLSQTGLALPDIGIAKPAGQAGTLDAEIEMRTDAVAVSELALAFGDVRLEGALEVASDGALRSADFSTFRISPGDDARVALAPRADGVAVTVRGSQLDIKPILGRFFDLGGEVDAGASAELEDQVFSVDVVLDRALGHYGTTAYNVDLDLTIRGDEIRRANASAQLGGTAALAVTTNVGPSTRTVTYASSDVGTLMRFIGIYPRLLGGNGTLVVTSGAPGTAQEGEFVLSNFAIFGEENLSQVIGTHSDSQTIAGAGQVGFDEARGSFVAGEDVIVLTDAALYGDTVGGTLRGNIFTQTGEYDLVGTYVPLFGLNNAFAQIPILGPIFGGREGEGLLGVTFAVRGALDQPIVLINPVSILAPGVFRGLFEFRAAQDGGR